MRALIPPFLLLALAAAGCFGSCGPTPTMEFFEPTAFAALANDDAKLLAPSGGAPIDVQGWGVVEVREVRENATHGRMPRAAIDLTRDPPRLTLMTTPEATKDDVAALTEPTLIELTNATSDERARIVDALWASRQANGWGPGGIDAPPISYAYEAPAAVQLRLSELLAAGGIGPGSRPSFLAGGALAFYTVDSAGRAWQLSLPVREVVVDGVQVRADVAGQVAISIEEEGDTARAIERARNALTTLGIEPPTFTSNDVRTVVC